MLEFIGQLRTLSRGKPTGFKFCLGHPWEWFAIVKAMLATGITPDFIVVDGAEGGTGAAPLSSATTWVHHCKKVSAWCTTRSSVSELETASNWAALAK